MRTENSLDRHIKVSWVKAYQILCLFIFTSICPLTKRLEGLAVEMYRMKRLLNSFNRKQQRRLACIQITHKRLQFQSLGQQSLLKKK